MVTAVAPLRRREVALGRGHLLAVVDEVVTAVAVRRVDDPAIGRHRVPVRAVGARVSRSV